MNWAPILEAAAWIFWGAVIVAGGTWYGLKAWDWLDACLYEYRKRNPKAPCQCPSCSPELWGEMPAVVVISRTTQVTPDRPRAMSFWAGKSVEEICRELEGRN